MDRINDQKNPKIDAAKVDRAHHDGIDRLENHGLLLMQERSGEAVVDREFGRDIKPTGTDSHAGRLA